MVVPANDGNAEEALRRFKQVLALTERDWDSYWLDENGLILQSVDNKTMSVSFKHANCGNRKEDNIAAANIITQAKLGHGADPRYFSFMDLLYAIQDSEFLEFEKTTCSSQATS